MTRLKILRGVPASGKSTHAWTYPEGIRVNRDDIRFAMFSRFTDVNEDVVTQVEHAQIEAGLAAGETVTVDATNLNRKFLSAILRIAACYDVEVEFKDFPISLKQAVENDDKRKAEGGRSVGRKVIERFFKRYKIDQTTGVLPAPPAVPEYGPKYTPDISKPDLYTFDLDGTLALHNGRNPYDTSKYAEDEPNRALSILIRSISERGAYVGILSGREQTHEDVCWDWLVSHELSDYVDFMWMRPAGDKRPDDVIKVELFDQYIAPNFNHQAHWDDRSRVVRALRSKGVTVHHVISERDGEF